MQSGYGVSEIPQFLVDGLCSPLFPSAADQHPPPHHHGTGTTATAPPYHLYHFPHQQPHHLQQFYHHIHQQPPPAPPPLQPQQLDAARFAQFHPVPITQQLFEQTHQFQLFEQQRRGLHAHLGLEPDSPPPPATSAPPTAPPPFMSFRLAVNEASGGGGGASRDGLNDDDGLLPADEEACESRMNLWAAPPREEETAIKEPFWRPLDIDYMNSNSKRCKEETAVLKQPSPKHLKEASKELVPDHQETTNTATNYKLFSELEAICKPGATAAATTNPTGSSSALTGDNNPPAATIPVPPNCADPPADHASNASTGDEEGSLKKGSTVSSKARRRRRRKQQLSCVATFFESLMKQLMDHQESLHHRFLQVLENRDLERAKKEQQWREQEAARSATDARTRAEQQAVAAAREAAIVSFLEKITGKPLYLPTLAQFESEEDNNAKRPNSSNALAETSDENRAAALNSNRWPKAEVQALIKVRSGLESRFQEPGLKGPLWEEVSSAMAAMGYCRSAKRCKQKWENINKYFRKTKESNKKRPQHSKTCPYFHQLDQLYSNSKFQTSASPMEVDRRGNSELLDAIVVAQTETDARDEEEEDHGDEEEEEGDDVDGEGETPQLSSHDHSSLFFLEN